MKERNSESVPAAPLQIGDHLALDFLNTVAQVDGEPHDFFQRDEDVARWLEAAGCLSGTGQAKARAGTLLTAARQLRAVILQAVERKKREEAWQPEELNRFLRSASSHLELALNRDGQPEYRRVYAAATPEQQLGPVAEQAADLLVNGDFSLVRECEHPDCTLWFYDRTKAHRRRWCSMALCGNRAKAARFRRMTQS
ncbi:MULTISPECIES: CGNR zinc finger domain-containing protein [Pantoea]|mgnify:CR=1 FL=1|nr:MULTISPECIES: ABATE domain-containing protein [Pantoea]MBS6435579.1 CGNR zinc finger domain-containing protein [Pantoea sp.]MDU2727685.1 CGNR zinc finger domain-containing protein [Pantoea sp.]